MASGIKCLGSYGRLTILLKQFSMN